MKITQAEIFNVQRYDLKHFSGFEFDVRFTCIKESGGAVQHLNHVVEQDDYLFIQQHDELSEEQMYKALVPVIPDDFKRHRWDIVKNAELMDWARDNYQSILIRDNTLMAGREYFAPEDQHQMPPADSYIIDVSNFKPTVMNYLPITKLSELMAVLDQPKQLGAMIEAFVQAMQDNKNNETDNDASN